MGVEVEERICAFTSVELDVGVDIDMHVDKVDVEDICIDVNIYICPRCAQVAPPCA